MARSLLITVMLAALAATAPPAAAQRDGDVRQHVKVSSQTGNFGGVLEMSDQMGRAIARLGDLDGDGIGDVAVSVHGSDDGGHDQGGLWVLFMNVDGTVRTQQKISALHGGFTGELGWDDELGRALEPLGDLDGDGVMDLAVGAAKDAKGGLGTGAVWILFLNPDGTVKAHTKIAQNRGGFSGAIESGDQFGRALARLSDLDGDGVPELAVGATYDDDGAERAGAIWVLFLRTDGTVKGWNKISNASGDVGVLEYKDYLAMALANLGDLDGDGFDELAVGVPGDDDGPVPGVNRYNAGAVYILWLRADGSVRRYEKISLARPDVNLDLSISDWFGYSLANLGDLNGDGNPDLAVGAFGDDGLFQEDDAANVGAVWLLCIDREGRLLEHNKIDHSTPGLGARLGMTDWFGGAVESLGDHDGDGVIDLAVGSRFDDGGTQDAGAVYMIRLWGQVTPQPVAAFGWLQPVGSPSSHGSPGSTGPNGAGRTVHFRDGSSGAVTAWEWDFGDGSGVSHVHSPTHVYTTPGVYRVRLTVGGPPGTTPHTVLHAVRVATREPGVGVGDVGGAPRAQGPRDELGGLHAGRGAAPGRLTPGPRPPRRLP